MKWFLVVIAVYYNGVDPMEDVRFEVEVVSEEECKALKHQRDFLSNGDLIMVGSYCEGRSDG